VRARGAYDFRVNSARGFCLLLAVGCATPAAALRADNRRLAATVSELRSDRRAQDRKLRDLQHQLDELRAQAADSAPPTLPVEVVAPAALPGTPAPAPDAARVVGVTDDGTEIVYEGDAMGVRPPASPPPSDDEPAARRVPRAVAARPLPAAAEIPVVHDRLEVTRQIPPISARAALPARSRERGTERAGAEGDDYRAAVDLVKAARYGDALGALRAFLAHHPRHDYADNAQYWIGEVFYAQHDYPHALAEFRRVIEVYPRGNKVPDALLKVGFCYQAMGQGDKARAALQQVVRLYPMSEPAGLAAKRLENP